MFQSFFPWARRERTVQTLWFAALIVVVTATLLPSTIKEIPVGHTDKLLHFAAYFGLGALGGTGWPDQRVKLLVLMPLFGLALELVQGGMVTGRYFDSLDAVANAVGAFVGVAVSFALRQLVLKDP